MLRTALVFLLCISPCVAHAQVVGVDAPAVDEQGPEPDQPQPPVYEEWWFWTAIGAIVAGITLAIVVDLTTDDPASSSRDVLVLRF